MQYNIFVSTHKSGDTVFNNLKRKIQFYHNTDKIFQEFGVYGATILKTVGFYEGKKERSFMMSIITEKDKDTLIQLCEALRSVNNQESVLLQVLQESILIYKDKTEKNIINNKNKYVNM